MGLSIDCHFLSEVQLLYLRFHIEVLSFEDSEWSVDARKWSAKWRNWNISDIFFSLSSKEGRKQCRPPGTFAQCMRKMQSERARQENFFLVLRRIVLTLVTLHVQEDLQGLMKDCLNTLNHMIQVSVLENWQM